MLVFDELKKNDLQLRLVAMMLAGGLAILLVGLWWVQVVSSKEYQNHLETQAYRTVRIPAVRGKILDREGRVLAENRPRYNLSLYLDELRSRFDDAYTPLLKQARANQIQAITATEKKLGRSLNKAERKRFVLTASQIQELRTQARLSVATEMVGQVSHQLGQSIVLNPVDFNRHYATRLAMPYPIAKNINDAQIARFEEQSIDSAGLDLELQSARVYNFNTLAAHLLGELRADDSSKEGEDSFYNYYLLDYKGVAGIEARFDAQLRGRAGSESVQVNNLGYRQSEDILEQPEPGQNVVLTIDLDIQRAAEESFKAHRGEDGRGAIVVMDVRSGDILAMVSSPTFDPNDFAQGISTEKYERLQTLTAEKNRATYENYAPGSIFKTVVALAALENGLNPNEIYHVQANPEKPDKGVIFIGRRAIRDTAPPGDYDFKKAFIHSSNSYFVTNGLRAGVENIIRIGQKFHLGERTGIFERQETGGNLPTLDRVNSSSWHAGDTANLCIGQGEVNVTPVQMAVMTSAIANGGKVLWPRIVSRIEPQNPSSGGAATNFPSSRVRDQLDVHPRSLKILQDAMHADVADSDGTAYEAFHHGGELKMSVCGKTGTAQVQDSANHFLGYNFWFASFAPYENPRYAVVVMAETTETHGSGGIVCAPIARDIYEALVKKLNIPAPRALASSNGRGAKD